MEEEEEEEEQCKSSLQLLITVFLPAELTMGEHEALQSDRELNVTAPHHVLDLELHKLCLRR